MNEKNNAFPPKNHSIFIKGGGGRGDGGGSNGFQGGRKGGSFEYNRTLWGDQVNFIVKTKSSDPPPFLPLAPLKS